MEEKEQLEFIRKAEEGDVSYIQTHLPYADTLTRERTLVYGAIPV